MPATAFPNGVIPLGQSHVPLILPGAASTTLAVAAGSAAPGGGGPTALITNSATMPVAYPAAYHWVPANTIFSGQTAGWYYGVWSSTGAFTLYNNIYTSGTPSIPGTLVGFSSVTAGNWTPTAGLISAFQYTVAAGTVGANDELRLFSKVTVINNANTHTYRLTVGGTVLRSPSIASTAQAYEYFTLSNCGAANINAASTGVGSTFGVSSGSGVAPTVTAIDFSQSQVLAIGLQAPAATDYMVLDVADLDLRRAA